MNRVKRYIISIISIIVLVLIDQYTKYLAITNLKNKSPFILIDGVLQFNYLENTGAAWGILSGKRVFFIILTSIILVLLLYFIGRIPSDKKYNPLKVFSVMLMAGAIGNLIDRIKLNYVVDFIYFNLIDFPVFNIADCYVTISCVTIAILYVFYYKDEDYSFVKLNYNGKRKG